MTEEIDINSADYWQQRYVTVAKELEAALKDTATLRNKAFAEGREQGQAEYRDALQNEKARIRKYEDDYSVLRDAYEDLKAKLTGTFWERVRVLFGRSK